MFVRTDSSESTYLNSRCEDCSYGAVPDNERAPPVGSGLYEEAGEPLSPPNDKEEALQKVGSVVAVLLLGRQLP